MVKEVNYMKEKNLSWSLNEEDELKTFHSTMHRYIKDNNGAVFIDERGKKYTINDIKSMYNQNIFYKFLVGSFIFYKVGEWTYYKVKKYFSHDKEFEAKKDSNKKNQQDDQDRENI